MSGYKETSVENEFKTELMRAFQCGYYQYAYHLLEALLQQNGVNTRDKALEKSERIAKECQECRQSQERYRMANIEAQQRESALRQEFSDLWHYPDNPSVFNPNSSGDPAMLSQILPERIECAISHQLSWLGEEGANFNITEFEFENQDKETSATQDKSCTSIPSPVKGERNLTVYCLGDFRVFDNERLIAHWPNSKSKDVFKYLLLHRQQPVKKEVLMGLFWPDADISHARNSLNVAIYRVRRTLSLDPEFSPVLYKEDSYLFNPELSIWVDAELFLKEVNLAHQYVSEGLSEKADDAYHAAEVLYLGDLLKEDLYESWLVPLRQNLREEFMQFLEAQCDYHLQQSNFEKCIEYSNKVLNLEPCHEQAHRNIMVSYSRLKEASLAVRQYHLCVDLLRKELNMVPSMNTVNLYQKLRLHHSI